MKSQTLKNLEFIDFCINEIESAVDDGWDTFSKSPQIQVAVYGEILNLGQVLLILPDEMKFKISEFPWKWFSDWYYLMDDDFGAIREVDAWKFITQELPRLKMAIRKLAAEEAEKGKIS